jgi:hypothetical protein
MPGGILVPKGAQVTVALHALMINPEHWKVRPPVIRVFDIQ